MVRYLGKHWRMYNGPLLFYRIEVIILVFAMLSITVTLEALNPDKQIHQYNLDSWSTEQGLPQSSVMTIVQAENGYIWLGTQEGLARFDGIGFNVFDKSNTKAFEDNHVVRLTTGLDGTLWIATYNDIVAFREGIFSAISKPSILKRTKITTLLEDSAGTLWVGTESVGLIAYRMGQFTFFTTKQGLSGDNITCLVEDRRGRLLVGISGGGIMKIEKGGLQVVAIEDGRTNYTPTVMLEDKQGDFWIGTSTDGLYHFRTETGLWHRYSSEDHLGNAGVITLIEDQDRSLWIGTSNGLFRLKDGVFDSITSKSGLSDDGVESLLEDVEGNIWVGTYGGGLNRLKDGNVVTYGKALGLSHDDVMGLYEDHADDVLWVATSGGGLNKFQRNRFTTYANEQRLPNNIYAICRDRWGTLWLGSREGLYTVTSMDDVDIGSIDKSHTIPADVVILSLFEDSRGRLWCGTEARSCYLIEKGQVRHITERQGFRGASIVAIAEDNFGKIWFGTDGDGLISYDGSEFVNYTIGDGLSSNNIMCLYFDDDGYLWIGTYGGGLACLREGNFLTWTMNDGLFSDSIFSILEDNDEALWMSCNKGIFSITKRDLLLFRDKRIPSLPTAIFGVMEGMKSAECNGGFQSAGLKRRDGSLWFSTIRGVASVIPSALKVNPFPPRVIIERSIVDGRPFAEYSSHALPAGSDKLEFHFTGLSYTTPERISYQYRLDGYESEWVKAGSRRVAYYTNIKPGQYTFQVYACNSDGICSTQPEAISFSIRPLYFQTIWFWLIVCLLAIVASSGIFKLHVRSFKLRERELTRLVGERASDLIEMRAKLEKANIALAHMSITDPLTGIANRRHFDEVFMSEWNRAIALSLPISFILSDIDFFKDYNDLYGHQAGDDCLIRVATAFCSMVHRSSDIVGRYGGEEFAICLFDTDIHGAKFVGENVRAAVEALAIPHERSTVAAVVTISMGCASIVPNPHESIDKLIYDADKALYAAKYAGKNRVVIAERKRLKDRGTSS